ncbi:unnamed protein product, partial [Amoebophrya sp. A120]
ESTRLDEQRRQARQQEEEEEARQRVESEFTVRAGEQARTGLRRAGTQATTSRASRRTETTRSQQKMTQQHRETESAAVRADGADETDSWEGGVDSDDLTDIGEDEYEEAYEQYEERLAQHGGGYDIEDNDEEEDWDEEDLRSVGGPPVAPPLIYRQDESVSAFWLQDSFILYPQLLQPLTRERIAAAYDWKASADNVQEATQKQAKCQTEEKIHDANVCGSVFHVWKSFLEQLAKTFVKPVEKGRSESGPPPELRAEV